MEIVKITKERMSQILPQTVKDSDLSVYAQKVLATIINYHLINEKVRTTGFLAINNEDLRKSAGVGKNYVIGALRELIECKLIDRKVGAKWKVGEQKMASEYRLILENLKKPIKKPSSDELLEMLFSTPSEPLCTGDSPTNTNSISNTISDSISNTISNSLLDTDTFLEEMVEKPKNLKELNDYFIQRMEKETRGKDLLVDDLNSLETKLEAELEEEFTDIPGHENIVYFIRNSMKRKREKMFENILQNI
jgi:hypothetical protein